MAPEHADESGLSRRDFLERTAYAAGLAGTAGLSAETILAEAARRRSAGPGCRARATCRSTTS